MKDLIESLVQTLVDDPSLVRIGEIPGDDAVTYEVEVARADLGKVIGKQGRVANALRTVAKAAATKSRRRVYGELVG